MDFIIEERERARRITPFSPLLLCACSLDSLIRLGTLTKHTKSKTLLPLPLFFNSLFLCIIAASLCSVLFCSSREKKKTKKMEMVYYQLGRPSFQDSVKVLEADIHYANAMAATIPRAKGGARLQMKLVYNQLAPLLLFLLQWMDCSCTCLLPRYLNLFHVLIYKVYPDSGRPSISSYGRKASIRDFYAVILPSLERLQGNLQENVDDNIKGKSVIIDKKKMEVLSSVEVDQEREHECGICLEPCTKMVLPNCCHAMCIKCYRNWNMKSESCPFCRGSLKRVKSEDLWVLTCDEDVVDKETVSKEDLLRFYLYISSLPKDTPDALFLVYYEYLI